MADIAMCKNNQCQKRFECYRFTAVPNSYKQSYFCPTIKDGICDSFWSNHDREQHSNTETKRT